MELQLHQLGKQTQIMEAVRRWGARVSCAAFLIGRVPYDMVVVNYFHEPGAYQRPLVVSDSGTAPPFELFDAWRRGSNNFSRGSCMWNKYMAGWGVEWGQQVIPMMLEHTQMRDLGVAGVAERTLLRTHRLEWMDHVMTWEDRNVLMDERIYPMLAIKTRQDISFVPEIDAGAQGVLVGGCFL